MRKESVGLGVVCAVILAATACTEPRLASRIESVGTKVIDSVVANSTRTLTARVTDQNHKGMAGVDVEWRVLTGSGTISATQTTTSGDGMTSVTFTAPATSGDMTSVTSGIPILGSASSFTLVVK